jgi:hypothetical protein
MRYHAAIMGHTPDSPRHMSSNLGLACEIASSHLGEAMKKSWTKPELIVLVRSKPEEATLAACKGLTPVGPAGSAGCVDCSGMASS